MKTYKNSYLYNGKNTDKMNKLLSDYILNSIRIDKNSEEFVGIKEDIKRRQTSSIVYQILNMPNVVLCRYNSEMPRAFKVMDAYDARNNRRPTIFIDCTGLIETKNGFLSCKKIDVLITYLYSAAIYLLYRNAPTRLFSNSDIILSSTKCYTILVGYIFDYLRVVGYSENKDKIMYLAALFHLTNMMGKDLDNNTKNIAARIANVDSRYIIPYNIYITDDIFNDINTFISSIAEQFNLKEFNLQVFIEKWIRLLGTGTQYASELWTNFGIMLTTAYSGTYLVNQNQIERSCGTDLVKFNNAIKQIAMQTFSSNYREACDFTSKEVESLSNMISLRQEEAPSINISAYASIEEAVAAVDAVKDFYKKTKQDNKAYVAAFKHIEDCIGVLESYIKNPYTPYEEGCLCAVAKSFKKNLGNPYINKVLDLLHDKVLICNEMMADEDLPKVDRSRASRCMMECINTKNVLQQ